MDDARPVFRFRSLLLLFALALFALVPAPPHAAFAQSDLKLPLPLPTVLEFAKSASTRRAGSLEVAPVNFLGQHLFDVAVLAARERPLAGVAAARAASIEGNIQDIVPPASFFDAIFGRYRMRFDPESFRVVLGSQASYLTLYATDASGQRSPILTLTQQDATLYGMPVADLASVWQERLQSVLGDALLARRPGAFRRQVLAALLAIAVAFVLVALLWLLRLRLHVRALAERDRLELMAERGLSEDGSFRRVRATLAALHAFAWLSNWAIVVLAIFGLLYVLYVFPYSEPFARTAGKQLVQLAVVWFVAGLANKFGDFAIARLAAAWEMRPFPTPEEASRRSARLPTVARAFGYAKSLIVYAVAAGVSLAVIGVPATSVITLGAALAFAISFGAQSLVKDLTNGFFILIEDQYAIGDYVSIDGNAGVIEHVTLRTTQLRSDDGRLITIPNSQVGVVANWTRSWSRVDFRVTLAYDADVDLALTVFARMLEAAVKDPQLGPLLIGPPRVLGVESVASTGIVLRALVKTVPGKMFDVSRELNHRARIAFSAAEIEIGMPVSRVFRSPEPERTPAPDGQAEPAGDGVRRE